MRGNSVLVVDDDADIARACSRSLRDAGWVVDVAFDGQQAMGALGERGFDALVVGLRKPADGRFDVLEQASRSPFPPASILVSAELDLSTVVRALRAGAADVIERPVKPDELDAKLRGVLGYVSDEPSPARVVEADAADCILGRTPRVQVIREQIRSVARFREVPVLVAGETGTGKELVAQAIHRLSGTEGPLVSINCAAIPETLFESELFGHELGSFTGATASRVGLLEAAGDGTLFFDEIGEMPPQLQPKLLRVLETREFRRVGGNRDLPFRARAISATNRGLVGGDTPVRSDLYFRLSGFTILAPPLRERMADVSLLARHFLATFHARYPEAPGELTPAALAVLHGYAWPGNVRELRAVVQQAAMLARGPSVRVPEVTAVLRERQACLGASPASPGARDFRALGAEPLRETERRLITDAWSESGKSVSGAARSLGLPRTTLRDKLRRYGLR
jgi:DNA-binding NtrC family response regulator